MPDERGPGHRAGLSRTAVVAAARDLLSGGGVEAVSLRAVARRLDVAPNAIYSHVSGKTDLIDALLDDLLGAVPVPAEDANDPVAALYELMTATYDVLVAHPDVVPLYLARQGARGTNAVSLGAVMEVLLTRAGVSADDVGEALRVLIVHTIGSAAFAANAGSVPEVGRTFLQSLRWLLTGIVQDSPPAKRRPSGGRSA